MGKKYLLYIHNDKFAEEVGKSGLVNLLLDRHYDYFKPGTLVEDLREHEDLDGSVVGSIQLASDLKVMKTKEDAEKVVKDLCPSHTLRMDCGRKGCKYGSR